jgi:choline dehydrogenase
MRRELARLAGSAARLGSRRYERSVVIAQREEFEVAVVGGGSAGCVVARRLAETTSGSVLHLEAGPDLRGDIPAALRDGWSIDEGFDWGYASEPDARGLADELRRGRLLGGTAWVTRFAPRGSPADYDEWAALGNPGWGFDDVLPYLTRLEADAEFGDQPWHGDSGPIPVTRYPEIELTEVAEAGLEALGAVGFPNVGDHNRPGAVGAGRMPMSSRRGIRVTPADAYIPLGDTPANLTIRPNAQVGEVVLEGIQATGIRLVDGSVVEAGWVVLCAGVYGSPAILMRSGIGPTDQLRSHQIPIRIDLPGVGQNLADHPAIDIECGSCGPTRDAPILHLLATFHSSASPSEAPDLMLWLSDPRGDPPAFEIDVGLLKPRSRGSVRLRSADPTEAPRIDLPGLDDPSDVDRLAEGYLRGLEVASRPELRHRCGDPPPAEPGSSADLLALIRKGGYSLPHVVGSCAMGPHPDDGAVVDSSGRVHGAERLNVADASIIPAPSSGFTQIPTIMLAERLSEEIASLL